jgi:hypothetical protein
MYLSFGLNCSVFEFEFVGMNYPTKGTKFSLMMSTHNRKKYLHFCIHANTHTEKI